MEKPVDIYDVEIAYGVSQKLTSYHLFEMIPSNFQEPSLLNSCLYTPPMSHSINTDVFPIQQ